MLISDDPALDWTGERFIPGLGGEIEFEHVHRYLFARQFCVGKDVLDIASGEGYGAYILAESALNVVGIDVAENAVQHASRKYKTDNLRFKLGRAEALPLANASIDVVVSFETLEHLEEQSVFLGEIKRVLRPGGLLVMSTPDRDVFFSSVHNEYHVRELNFEEFQNLIDEYFEHYAVGRQKALAGSVILPVAKGGVETLEVFSRPDRSNFVVSNLPSDAAYFISVASDGALPPIRWGVLDDVQFLRQTLAQLDNTQTWVAHANDIAQADQDIISPCLYSRAEGNDFSEATAVRQILKLTDEPQVCVLQTPIHETGVVGLRLDLTDANRSFVLHELAVETVHGDVVFLWNGDPAFINSGVRMEASLARDGGALVVCGPDPQLLLPLPVSSGEVVAKALRVKIVLRLDPASKAGAGNADKILEVVTALDTSFQDKFDFIARKVDAGAEVSGRRTSVLEGRINALSEAVARIATDLNEGLHNLDRLQAEVNDLKGSVQVALQDRAVLANDVKALHESVSDNTDQLITANRMASDQMSAIAAQMSSISQTALSAAEQLAMLEKKFHDQVNDTETRHADTDAAIKAANLLTSQIAAGQTAIAERLDELTIRSTSVTTVIGAELESLKSEMRTSANQTPAVLASVQNRLIKTQSDALDVLQNNLAAHVEQRLRGLESAFRDELAKRLDDTAETTRLLIEAAGQKARLETLQREIGVEGGGLRESLAAIARLKSSEQRAITVLTEVYRSSSWRITAPIRAVKSFLTTGKLPGAGTRQAQRVSDESVHLLPAAQEVAPPPAAAIVPPEYTQITPTHPTLEELEPTPITTKPPLADPAVKVVAFYLPQFHPIPENDAWWGKGFTEWTNVTRATMQFSGHYQPHLPSDLGFYDLRVPEVQEKQVQLAKLYGVGAFCFYFYWFAGKRLLETPIEQFAENPNIDFPFCLCWANENWSRRWDGLDAEILIGQNHSPEDDIAFITHVSRYMNHRNYIRVGGRPMLVIYRPNLLPDPKSTAERWRAWCRENGVGEIYLAYMQSFEVTDPQDYGFDAAIEFPPNNTAPPVITEQMEQLNPAFTGTVYDYRVYPERSQEYSEPTYTLFRGVFPSWDNEARRRGRGSVWANATPARYQKWLENAAKETIARLSRQDERLVFVNAWNEWAEGAHLEPDQHYGYAWLEATRNALEKVSVLAGKTRFALVTHDAYTHGAQFLALNIGRRLIDRFDILLDVVTLGDGPLVQDFAKLGELHSLAGLAHDGIEARALAANLKAKGVEAVLCSTTVSGVFLGVLHEAGLRTVCLVHELAGIISSYKLERHSKIIATKADVVVFPGPKVRASFETFEIGRAHV